MPGNAAGKRRVGSPPPAEDAARAARSNRRANIDASIAEAAVDCPCRPSLPASERRTTSSYKGNLWLSEAGGGGALRCDAVSPG